jgi:hypothetical protein
MIRVMSDNDVRGHLDFLLMLCRTSLWHELWTELNVDVCTFRDLDLPESASDAVVWRACQRNGVVLITGNRSAKDNESLEVTIRNENRPDSLPVFTFADRDRILRDRDYAEAALLKLLGFLLDLERLRGAGRLFLP